jgi:hypothetical protein
MRCGRRAFWIAAFLLLLLAAPALYAKDGDQVHIGGRSINVGPDEAAGDLVCVGCSIRMQGSCGDMVAVGGSVDVGGHAKGDIVVIGGGLRLGEESTVSGDIVTIGGSVSRDPNSVIHGRITSRSGALLLVWLVLMPLLPVILIVALVVWLVGRNRRDIPVRA